MQTRAAICASEDGRYDQFSESLFERAVRERADLVALAVDVGMDRVMFERCIDSTRTRDQVAEQLRLAKEDNITGTPTILAGKQRQVGLGIMEKQCLGDPAH